jgi:hypothetical protein
MIKNVEITSSPIQVKTVQIDSKKLTRAALNVLPVLPPTWHDLYQSKKIVILGKIARDVTEQIFRKRGYIELIDLYFDYGLVVHYDEQLFLTIMPSKSGNYSFSQLWSELKNKYKAISNDLRNDLDGFRWPEDDCLTEDERDKMNHELDLLEKKIAIIEEQALKSINEISSTTKYLFI